MRMRSVKFGFRDGIYLAFKGLDLAPLLDDVLLLPGEVDRHGVSRLVSQRSNEVVRKILGVSRTPGNSGSTKKSRSSRREVGLDL